MKKWGAFVMAILFMTCGGILPCMGQIMPDSMIHGSYSLYYSHGRTNIDKDLMDNASQIFRIRNILSRSTRIDNITIYSYASPEGSLSRNRELAKQRALAAKNFILANLPDSTVLLPENISIKPLGENWEGLKRELEANYHRGNRDKVIKIINSKIPAEKKKKQLRNLDNGKTYNWIIQHHMSRLRLATWDCVYAPLTSLYPRSASNPAYLLGELQPMDSLAEPETFERKTILAIKSNLLYDALTLVNYSIEIPVTKHFSALFYHQFPWWRWGEAKNEYCIRFLSIGAEVRWWFRFIPGNRIHHERDRLSGHFLGIYAESGKWDFQWKRSICHQGEHWSTGLTYGYSMPLGKVMNLEFSLSMGYASIPYRRFIPSDNYEILWREPGGEGRWHYFGPTKAQISLSLPIKITTRKKGGKQ